MLTISKALNASQAGTYHTKDFASETQSYYAKEDALLGEWQGELADRLGLSGAVSKANFMALANGQHPQTGEQMVKHRIVTEQTNADGSISKTVEHRAGWDATFSAPKSVSLTALVGGDERVRLAHREAVTAALSELERYTQAATTPPSKPGGSSRPSSSTILPARWMATPLRSSTPMPLSSM
jgi:conjugative relaxase-like TrwC/TraI family protein